MLQQIFSCSVTWFTFHIRQRESCWRSHLLFNITSYLGGAGTSSGSCAAFILCVGACGSAGGFWVTRFLQGQFLPPMMWYFVYRFPGMETPDDAAFRHPLIHASGVWTGAVSCSSGALVNGSKYAKVRLNWFSSYILSVTAVAFGINPSTSNTICRPCRAHQLSSTSTVVGKIPSTASLVNTTTLPSQHYVFEEFYKSWSMPHRNHGFPYL